MAVTKSLGDERSQPTCHVCGRNTGQTVRTQLCTQCKALAAIAAALDASESQGHDSLFEPFEPEILQLVAEIRATGGDVSHWELEFLLVEPYVPEGTLLLQTLIQMQNERDPATWNQLREATRTGRPEQASFPFDV